jgi:hypothetical protein
VAKDFAAAIAARGPRLLGWYNREQPHQGHANRGLTPADRIRELACPVLSAPLSADLVGRAG